MATETDATDYWDPKRYVDTLGVSCPYVNDAPRESYINVGVLPELVGKPWDRAALAMVLSLQPSAIRVTHGECKSNAHVNRVTVIVKDRPSESEVLVLEQVLEIRSVTMERRVPLPPEIYHGHHLRVAVEHGLGSEREQREAERNRKGEPLVIGNPEAIKKGFGL